MKRYQLTYRKSVAKDLRAIPKKHRQAIVRRIEKLAADPKPPGYIKIKGAKDLFRLRQAEYRIIYQINEDTISILVIKIGHRKDVYRFL